MSEYSVRDHGSMICDRVRTDAYAQALEQLVRPGAVVLDIGTGSGIFALLAAGSGARRIFAVEDAEIIELARELAVENGLAARITFIRNLSTRVELPEPADVIVSDLHGALPLYKAHIPSIVDARGRHLAEGGALIPFRETLWAAPAELRTVYEERVSSWEVCPYGLDLSPARSYAANSWGGIEAPADALLGDPVCLAVLDYRSITSPNVRSSAELGATRSGTLHGVVVWFDSELAEGVGFSNAPGQPQTVYRQAFFPLLEPLDVAPDDSISFDFAASLVHGDYVFRWDTRVTEPSSPTRVKAAFTQSTLFGSPLSPESLATREAAYAPTRTDDGEVVAFLLGRADGHRTLGELSQEIAERFPHLFGYPGDALSFVTEITQKYCR